MPNLRSLLVLRHVEVLLLGRWMEASHEMVRFLCNIFGPTCVAESWKMRAQQYMGYPSAGFRMWSVRLCLYLISLMPLLKESSQTG